ncbi:MAG: Wzz/FepE/Etk N-terminal domain-containing protein [Steroidobacteraceae bacterium]
MSVLDLAREMWRRSRLVGAICAVCVGGAVVWALVMTPVYRSEVVVMPASDGANSDGLGGLSSSLGGLAALAGVSLGGGRQGAESLALLKSRTVLEMLIADQNLLPQLFANKWDAAHKQWRVGVKQPTIGQAVEVLRLRVYQVREDIKSGLVTIRVDWTDREAAARWANRLVEIANEEARRRTIQDASNALAELNEQLKGAESVELRTALSRLMEAQLRAKTLAQVRREYAFAVIDKAIPSEPNRRVRPARTLMVVLSAIFGLVLSAAIVAWAVKLPVPSGESA